MRALEQRERLRPAQPVIGHVVGVFRIGPRKPSILLAARQHDVAPQVAPRKVETHPADRIVHRKRRFVARLPHVDVIAALLLIILQQFGPVELHPGVQRDGFEPIGIHRLLLGAGGQRHQPRDRRKQETHTIFHNCLRFFYSTSSTVKNHATGLSSGTMPKFSSP